MYNRDIKAANNHKITLKYRVELKITTKTHWKIGTKVDHYLKIRYNIDKKPMKSFFFNNYLQNTQKYYIISTNQSTKILFLPHLTKKNYIISTQKPNKTLFLLQLSQKYALISTKSQLFFSDNYLINNI